MAELFAHQREALAVAARRSVLLCSAGRVGKTLLAAMRVRAWLLAVAHGVHNGQQPPNAICVALAPTPEMRTALRHELARLCSAPVWTEVAAPTRDDDMAELARQLARLLLQDAPPSLSTTAAPLERVRVAILSPKLFQAALRKRLLQMQHIALLVLEGADEIHDSAPSLYRQAFDEPDGAPVDDQTPMPLIFATTSTPASALEWDPARNPLMRHIHVLNMVPVVPHETAAVMDGQREPPLPLLLSEPFEANASEGHLTTLSCAVRDFLLGENKKKIDYVRIFRMELEMGNSAAVYDDKKKQERVNRFIQDAESVYQHLGMWCLLKYVELELQFNLQACLVEDVDNINRRRRARLLQQQQQHKNPELAPTPDQDGNDEDDEENDAEEDDNEGPSVRGSKTLEALVESASPNLDEAKMKSIKGILKVLSSLSKEAVELGARAASPRLQKVASITRCRLMSGANNAVDRLANGDTTSTAPRCWVFVERRTHCTVVAEYLTFALSDLGLPPCCSMLGHSNARVVGSLHFSSYLKVITMFKTGETNVLVTTSIANKSQRIRQEPPQCDLVVIMDETQEPEKLIDYCHRAYTRGGVVKYVTPQGPAEERKFQVLVGKFKEAVELEASAEVPGSYDQVMKEYGNPPPAVVPQTSAQSVPAPTLPAPSDNVVKPTAGHAAVAPSPSATKPPSPVPVIRLSSRTAVPAPAVTYEIVYKDTGAKLSLENSVSVLSKFCETLPGLDTYDRRPQYYIKRHQIAGLGMTASMKQQKKKKLKYNCNLEDKIDDIKAQAEAREDADVDIDAEKTDESYSSSGRFLFTAKLRLPVMIGAKKEIGSAKVSSDAEAKAIVAFKGCQELIKKGLLDRHFCSTLECDTLASDPNNTLASDTTVYVDDEDRKKSSQSLTDLSAQNSYDLPPVGAAELGLPTVRSLMDAATVSREGDIGAAPAEEVTVSMCFYAIEGIRYAILSSKELYTGNTNTGWRYDFATSDVMEPVVNRATLHTKAIQLRLTKSQLEEILHFHLLTMRLACMKVDDAMREIDVKGDKVWNEFSEQNDKGYLVVPSRLADNSGSIELDWEYLREIVGKPLLVDCWPLPAEEVWPSDEWVCVPKFRRNVCYVLRQVTKQKASEVVKPMAEVDATWAAHFKTKPVAGVPIFGRWHSREQVKQADPDQPLLHGVQVPEIVPLIRRVMQRHHDEGSIAQSKSKFQERYFLPEFTSLLRLTKTRYFEAMGIVPLLYEFERKCQLSNLMMRIGRDVDLRLFNDATSKPDYERLEILGDTFLKLETSWHLFENRQDILEEGQLTQLRRDIIRNDRLNMFALAKNLHHYILYPAEIEQHPFKFWKPSCMGKTPESLVVPSKWVADVLEAICGAYLVNGGEVDARYFLKWAGVTVPDDRHLFESRYIPDTVPNASPPDSTAATLSRQRDLGFRVHRFDGITDRLVALQQRLKYTFNNKELLLEAITHPSVGALSITWDASSKAKTWYKNYERLEYLGDAVIEYLTLSYAFNKYGKWLPGSLSQWKAATVSNDALGKTAIVCFGIDECLLSGALRIDRESLATVASLERRYPRDEALSLNTHELLRSAKTKTAGSSRSQSKRKAPPPATAINSLGLPKMFADVFEALVAAVFLDSRHDLRTVRDVFLGPLIDVVGDDAFAYVCRESGLPMNNDPFFQDDDFMGELSPLSEDEDDT